MQLHRFEEVLGERLDALADAELRQVLARPSATQEAWWASIDEQHGRYDPERPLRVPTWSLAWHCANELDLLVVALRNVLRAQQRLPADLMSKMEGQEIIELLRNISEHWDEEEGPSATRLALEHPHISPTATGFTNKEIWLGGTEGIPLSRIMAWLGRVEAALLSALTEAGVETPKPRASQVPGDDQLPWPEERLYFHWSVPRVNEQDWPRGEIPEDVAEALAQIFANKRSRDHAD